MGGLEGGTERLYRCFCILHAEAEDLIEPAGSTTLVEGLNQEQITASQSPCSI